MQGRGLAVLGTMLILFASWAGCLGGEGSAGDAASGEYPTAEGDWDGTSSVPDTSIPTGNTTTWASTNATPSFRVDGPAWQSARFDLSGDAGEWVWLWQPFHQGRSDYSYEGEVSITAEGDGPVGVLSSHIQMLHRWTDDDRLDEGFPFYGADVAQGTARHQADRYAAGVSRSCGGCEDVGFYVFVGGTAPWNATVRLDIDDGGTKVTQPAYVERGQGVSAWSWTRPAEDPADVAATWEESIPVDNGTTVFGFDVADQLGGRGVFRVTVGDWGADTEFYEGLTGPLQNGRMGHNGTQAVLELERDGLSADTSIWAVHASELGIDTGLPDGFGEGRWN